MKIWFRRFNLLLLGLALALASCQTTDDGSKKSTKKGKEESTFRLHLETNPDGTDKTVFIPVYRENPFSVCIYKQPFLTEGDVEKAWIVDEVSSFSIAVQFKDFYCKRTLEMATTSYKGQHIAVFSQFGDARWLAAPVITRQITDGIFTFTPDATHEEAERMVRGLNNVVKKAKKKEAF